MSRKIANNGSNVKLTITWARNVWKLFNWVKRYRVTTKKKMNSTL